MKKEEKFLNNLVKANEQLEKALEILDDSYNMGNYLVNKNYNTYAINKIITIQGKLKCLKNGYYIEQNKKI